MRAQKDEYEEKFYEQTKELDRIKRNAMEISEELEQLSEESQKLLEENRDLKSRVNTGEGDGKRTLQGLKDFFGLFRSYVPHYNTTLKANEGIAPFLSRNFKDVVENNSYSLASLKEGTVDGLINYQKDLANLLFKEFDAMLKKISQMYEENTQKNYGSHSR